MAIQIYSTTDAKLYKIAPLLIKAFSLHLATSKVVVTLGWSI